MTKLKVLTMPATVENELLIKILRANYTKALLRIRAELSELRILVADAPDQMPVDDIKTLNKFIKDTEKHIDEMIY